jgi:SAM-dependent methyltransferase
VSPVTCPACGGAVTHWRDVPAAEPALAGRVFELLRCPDCGSAVTGGDEVAGLHDAGSYDAAAPRGARLAAPLLARFDAARVARVAGACPPPADLVDAGAGRGRFVAAATAAGYRAHGVEPAGARAAVAQAHGLDVAATTIEAADIAPASLDAVTLWHVLEHVDDPGSALAAIAGWLRPGGVLLVGVPNLGSWQARLGGARWYHLDVPRHRTHFTTGGLATLLAAHGFTVERTDHLLLEHNPFGMWQSLVNRVTATPSYLFNLLKRAVPLRPGQLAVSLLALPLVPVAALLEFAAGLLQRGGTVAVLTRRA